MKLHRIGIKSGVFSHKAASDLIGVCPATLHNWRKSKQLIPSANHQQRMKYSCWDVVRGIRINQAKIMYKEVKKSGGIRGHNQEINLVAKELLGVYKSDLSRRLDQ